MPEISVIIPIYNVEKYLRQCLNSVCNQTFRDIEIICVNDGSSDNSIGILREFEQNDQRILIINQKNQGLGAARNKGLKNANGNYVYFIDSDDYIEFDTLEKLHENAISNDSDVVLFKFKTFDDFENIHSRNVEFRLDKIFGDIDYNNFTFNYADVKRHVLNSAFSACLKLYKKKFLDCYDDFNFPENLSFEDILFHVKVMIRADKVSFVNEDFYGYRSNPDSILNEYANGFDIFKVIDLVEDFLNDNNLYNTFENEFIFFKIAQILKYIESTNSNNYFLMAKKEFNGLVIKNEKLIKNYALRGYKLVLNSNDYSDYLDRYYGSKISELKKDNKKLFRQNKRLKKINSQMLSSKSWKITKPLRSLKNLKK